MTVVFSCQEALEVLWEEEQSNGAVAILSRAWRFKELQNQRPFVHRMSWICNYKRELKKHKRDLWDWYSPSPSERRISPYVFCSWQNWSGIMESLNSFKGPMQKPREFIDTGVEGSVSNAGSHKSLPTSASRNNPIEGCTALEATS